MVKTTLVLLRPVAAGERLRRMSSAVISKTFLIEGLELGLKRPKGARLAMSVKVRERVVPGGSTSITRGHPQGQAVGTGKAGKKAASWRLSRFKRNWRVGDTAPLAERCRAGRYVR
jgi:hypothetical protein